LDQVIVKKISDSVYELIECPEHIEYEIWGDSIDTGYNPKRVAHFHSSWISRVIDVCRNNNDDILLIIQ
jgi:hypothetical protein